MYKISVVGIDNSGKTSIVSPLGQIKGVSTIHLTSYKNSKSKIARISGRAVNRLAQIGESCNLRFLAGFAYLSHLLPYYLEERAKGSSPVLVSDRDPIVDTICYSQFYASPDIAGALMPKLKLFLEH
jgi:hypothetical protein